MNVWQPGMRCVCVNAADSEVLSQGAIYTIREATEVQFGDGHQAVGLRLQEVVRPAYTNDFGMVFVDYPFGAVRFEPLAEMAVLA